MLQSAEALNPDGRLSLRREKVAGPPSATRLKDKALTMA